MAGMTEEQRLAALGAGLLDGGGEMYFAPEVIEQSPMQFPPVVIERSEPQWSMGPVSVEQPPSQQGGEGYFSPEVKVLSNEDYIFSAMQPPPHGPGLTREQALAAAAMRAQGGGELPGQIDIQRPRGYEQETGAGMMSAANPRVPPRSEPLPPLPQTEALPENEEFEFHITQAQQARSAGDLEGEAVMKMLAARAIGNTEEEARQRSMVEQHRASRGAPVGAAGMMQSTPQQQAVEQPAAEQPPPPPPPPSVAGQEPTQAPSETLKVTAPYENHIDAAARRFGVDPNMIRGVIRYESDGDPIAVAPKGGANAAQGLMQVKPKTAAEQAKRIGLKNYDWKNPLHNILVGTSYLKRMQGLSGGDTDKTLGGYHSGWKGFNEGRNAETDKTYISKVREYMGAPRQWAAGAGPVPERTMAQRAAERGKQVKQFGGGGDSPFDPTAMPVAGESRGWKEAPADIVKQEEEQIWGKGPGSVKSIADAEAAISGGLGQRQAHIQGWLQRYSKQEEERGEAERRKVRDEILSPIEKRYYSEIQKQSKGADPNRWWKNQSTGKKVANIIALALGAFTEGFTGGKVKNAAIGMIDKAIQRDIDAQKSEMMARKGNISGLRGAMADIYKKMGYSKNMEMMAKDNLYTSARMMAQEAVSNAKGPVAKLNAQKFLNELTRKHLSEMRKDKTVSVSRGRSGYDPFVRSMQMATFSKKTGVRPEKIDPVERRVFDSMSDYDSSIIQFKDYIKKLSEMDKTSGTLQEMVPKSLWTNKMHAINADRDEMIATMVRAKSGVAARPDEHKRLAALMPRLRETPAARAVKIKQVYDKAIAVLEGKKSGLNAIGKRRLIPHIDKQIRAMRNEIQKVIAASGGETEELTPEEAAKPIRTPVATPKTPFVGSKL